MDAFEKFRSMRAVYLLTSSSSLHLHRIQQNSETATLRYTRKVRESGVDFKGWRARKNNEVIGSLGNEPGSAYQCTDAVLRQFCLAKTVFLKLDGTLLLRITNTTVNDSGNYTLEWLFHRLESNEKEETQLDVVEGKQICDIQRYNHSKNSYLSGSLCASSAAGCFGSAKRDLSNHQDTVDKIEVSFITVLYSTVLLTVLHCTALYC